MNSLTNSRRSATGAVSHHEPSSLYSLAFQPVSGMVAVIALLSASDDAVRPSTRAPVAVT
jgi:hypothetical protein